jgi:hypothetical protein
MRPKSSSVMPSSSTRPHGATSGFAQPGCWSPARSADTTQKHLHVVLQVAGAPELTLLPLLPNALAPHPSTVPQDSSADLLQPPLLWCTHGSPLCPAGPSADLSTSMWVSLFLGAHAAGFAHGLCFSRGKLLVGRQHGLQHCSSEVEGLSSSVGILQLTSASHPLVSITAAVE